MNKKRSVPPPLPPFEERRAALSLSVPPRPHPHSHSGRSRARARCTSFFFFFQNKQGINLPMSIMGLFSLGKVICDSVAQADLLINADCATVSF